MTDPDQQQDRVRVEQQGIAEAAENLSDLARLLPEGSQAFILCERALANLDGAALEAQEPDHG